MRSLGTSTRARTLTGAAVVGALVLMSCGDDASDPQEVVEGGPAAGVTLEAVDREMPNPFVDEVLDVASDIGSVGTEVTAAIVDGVTSLPGEPAGVAGDLAGRTSTGDEPELYGGSVDAQVCDVDALVGQLTDSANAAGAEAWAGVQGVEPGQIEEYIGSLTPVRLLADTRVTNHGWEGGAAVPFQSVLQAGTAVLVDDQGVPRVRCLCGNPLTPPEPLAEDSTGPDDLIENPEDAWVSFDPADVLVVEPGGTMDSIVVSDIETGSSFERPVGSDGAEDSAQPSAEEGDQRQDTAEDPATDTTEPPTEDAPPDDASDSGGGDGGGGGTSEPPDRGLEVMIEQLPDGTCRATYSDGQVVDYAC